MAPKITLPHELELAGRLLDADAGLRPSSLGHVSALSPIYDRLILLAGATVTPEELNEVIQQAIDKASEGMPESDDPTAFQNSKDTLAWRIVNHLVPEDAPDGSLFVEEAGNHWLKLTIEVWKRWSGDDPKIPIYSVSVFRSGDQPGQWPETFGSVEKLQGFFKGLEVALTMTGYYAHLSWSIPETWTEPSGIRWILRKGEPPIKEELNAKGEVLTV